MVGAMGLVEGLKVRILTDGDPEGAELTGDVEGLRVGREVGNFVGLLVVGDFVVGLADGWRVGRALGTFVGLVVVGDLLVGLDEVGRCVGSAVGL